MSVTLILDDRPEREAGVYLDVDGGAPIFIRGETTWRQSLGDALSAAVSEWIAVNDPHLIAGGPVGRIYLEVNVDAAQEFTEEEQ